MELRNGKYLFAIRVNDNNFTKIFVSQLNNEWYYASGWDMNTLKYKNSNSDSNEFDIVRVYGLINETKFYQYADCLDLDGRKLLWQRKEPKTITVSQIRRLLGVSKDEEIFIEVDE